MSCLSWPSLDDCPCPCEACKRRRASGLTTFDNDQNRKETWLRTSIPNEEQQINIIKKRKGLEDQDRTIEENENDNGSHRIERLRGNQKIQSYRRKETYKGNERNGDNRIHEENEGNEEHNLESNSGIWSFIRESIGVLAYLSFLTLCLWVTLMSFGLKLGKKIYKSKNRLQILAYILLGIIVLLIIYGYSNYTASSRAKAEKVAKDAVRSSGKCPFNCMRVEKSTSNEKQNTECGKSGDSVKPGYNWKFWSNGKSPETTMTTTETKITTATVTPPNMNSNILEDEDNKKAEELMKQSKVYAVALEMKRPPQVLISLQEYFLQ